jgi:hypothetical protein
MNLTIEALRAAMSAFKAAFPDPPLIGIALSPRMKQALDREESKRVSGPRPYDTPVLIDPRIEKPEYFNDREKWMARCAEQRAWDERNKPAKAGRELFG